MLFYSPWQRIRLFHVLGKTMRQEFIIPYRPDSVNSHWCRSPRGTYLSKSGKRFREDVQKFMLITKHKKEEGKLRVFLELVFKDKRERDIDNYCKSIFDSLNGILWEDDRQIYELHTTKRIGAGKDYFKIVVERL